MLDNFDVIKEDLMYLQLVHDPHVLDTTNAYFYGKEYQEYVEKKLRSLDED